MGKNFKAFAVVLCLLLFAVMAMGSGSSGSGEDKDIASVSRSSSGSDLSESEKSETDESETKGNENTESEPVASESASQVLIQQQVLYDANGIKITANGLEDSWSGKNLNLLIENNCGRSITVQSRNESVNGYMVSTTMSAEVASGKKANDTLTFDSHSLKECGIDTIAVMEFSFHIFDSESWDDIVDTGMIRVETSAAAAYVQNYDDTGQVLVDTNGVKIIGKGLSAKDSFWGPGVILYIENNSDRNITVQVRDVSVNGFMVDSSMSEDVVPGKKAMSAVQFFSADLEKNAITDITNVELYFHIFDEQSWDAIFDSDVINIAF